MNDALSAHYRQVAEDTVQSVIGTGATTISNNTVLKALLEAYEGGLYVGQLLPTPDTPPVAALPSAPPPTTAALDLPVTNEANL